MENFQLHVSCNRTDKLLIAHVLVSFEHDGYNYARIMDLEMPEASVIRNVGFNKPETERIVRLAKHFSDELSALSEKNEPLIFISPRAFMRGSEPVGHKRKRKGA